MNKFLAEHNNAEGMLARNTLIRQKKKTRAIGAASITFIVIMIVTAFGGFAIKKAAEEKLGFFDTNANIEKWDYILTADRERYENVKQEIEQAEGVVETREWYSGMFVGDVPIDCYSKEYLQDLHEIYNLWYRRKLSDKDFNEEIDRIEKGSVCVLGVDPSTLKEVAKATGSDLKTLENTEKPAAIVMQEGVLSTDKYHILGMKPPEKYRFYDVKQMTDKKIGEILPVELYSEKEDEIISFPIQVAGYANNENIKEFVSFHSPYLWLIVSTDTAKKIGKILEENNGTEMMDPMLRPELYIKIIENDSDILNKLSKLSESEDSVCSVVRLDYKATLRDAIVGIMYVLLSCFVMLTSTICMLNLFNSIRSRVNGRTRNLQLWNQSE